MSQVWVIADVAEGDLADDQGRHARHRDASAPIATEPVEGVVTFIYPEREAGDAHRRACASSCPIPTGG